MVTPRSILKVRFKGAGQTRSNICPSGHIFICLGREDRHYLEHWPWVKVNVFKTNGQCVMVTVSIRLIIMAGGLRSTSSVLILIFVLYHLSIVTSVNEVLPECYSLLSNETNENNV